MHPDFLLNGAEPIACSSPPPDFGTLLADLATLGFDVADDDVFHDAMDSWLAYHPLRPHADGVVEKERRRRAPAPAPAPSLALKSSAQRLSVREAAALLGLPPRTVQDQAAHGKIPGAAKFGRRWTFDREKLRQFVRERERETWQNAGRHLDVSGGGKPFGVGSKFADANSDGRFTQVIQQLRARATKPDASG